MRFTRMDIPDVFLLEPRINYDSRGSFMESYRSDLFAESVGEYRFVQDNQSVSRAVGTVRGLHFQLTPRAQGKLVSCVRGAVLDVAVDIRRGSPTFGQHVKATLSGENGYQLWIPPGFAHGFCTLEPDSVVSYKVTDFYSHEHDKGLLWNDPELGIEWPVSAENAVLSDKDRKQPSLAVLDANFVYSR